MVPANVDTILVLLLDVLRVKRRIDECCPIRGNDDTLAGVSGQHGSTHDREFGIWYGISGLPKRRDYIRRICLHVTKEQQFIACSFNTTSSVLNPRKGRVCVSPVDDDVVRAGAVARCPIDLQTQTPEGLCQRRSRSTALTIRYNTITWHNSIPFTLCVSSFRDDGELHDQPRPGHLVPVPGSAYPVQPQYDDAQH